MDSILSQIKALVKDNIKTYLSDVSLDELEDSGALFYMNGNNGTEFDWHVNERLSFFMAFYNDEQNMGVAKLGLYQNGYAELFLFSEKGNKLEKELTFKLDIDTQDLLKLAVRLKISADDKKKWETNIDELDTDIEISEEMLSDFMGNADYYANIIEMRKIMNMTAIASKKAVMDGWKIGIMTRDKPNNESDSGWYFGAGNETEDYMSKPENFVLVSVAKVVRDIDPDVMRHLLYPAGTQLIRISSTEFMVDDGKEEIFCEKR